MIYRFLSRVLEREVDTALLDQAARLTDLGILERRVLDEDPECLAVDYCRLFVLPGRGLAPYQSVQSPENQLCGEPTSAMSQHLARLGLAPAKGFIADHAAVQLAVIAHLLESATQAEADDPALGTGPDVDYAVSEFFNAFLHWLPEYFERVATHAETAFYRAIAELGSAFLRREARVAADGE